MFQQTQPVVKAGVFARRSDLDAVLLGVALELGADAALGGAEVARSQRCSSPASRLRIIDLTGPTEAGAMEMER